jgi:hypothetical protein
MAGLLVTVTECATALLILCLPPPIIIRSIMDRLYGGVEEILSSVVSGNKG